MVLEMKMRYPTQKLAWLSTSMVSTARRPGAPKTASPRSPNEDSIFGCSSARRRRQATSSIMQ
jgi:hypothetical protein